MCMICNIKGAGPIWSMAGAGLVLVVTLPGDLPAANRCIFNWAQPGTYKLSGDFRGTVETATARLTHDCRVFFQVPGVFSGGAVRRSGRCLKFRFKVEGEAKVFSAKWCNTFGVVPWQGRDVKAAVTRIKVEAPPTPQRRNFNVQ